MWAMVLWYETVKAPASCLCHTIQEPPCPSCLSFPTSKMGTWAWVWEESDGSSLPQVPGWGSWRKEPYWAGTPTVPHTQDFSAPSPLRTSEASPTAPYTPFPPLSTPPTPALKCRARPGLLPGCGIGLALCPWQAPGCPEPCFSGEEGVQRPRAEVRQQMEVSSLSHTGPATRAPRVRGWE